MNPYANKVAIVTGGASGIGKTICEYLARHSAKVIIADCNLDEARETETYITSNGGFGKSVCVNVSHPEDIKSLIENTMEEYGQIDFLFNNAGVSINGEFKDVSLEQWKYILDVNLWGVIYGCHYVYPIMIKQGFGHIINTASLAGLVPGGLTTSYSTSKHAVVGFSLTLRSEARLYGIKVSVLCPGYLRTPVHDSTLNVSEFMNSLAYEMCFSIFLILRTLKIRKDIEVPALYSIIAIIIVMSIKPVNSLILFIITLLHIRVGKIKASSKPRNDTTKYFCNF